MLNQLNKKTNFRLNSFGDQVNTESIEQKQSFTQLISYFEILAIFL